MTSSKTVERSPGHLERALGFTFDNSRLLELALTHRSYTHEHPEGGTENNERLEFLGDAIFQFIVADSLFHRFPDMPEGVLSSARATLVSTESFSSVGDALGLARFVRVSRGEAALDGRGRHSILAGCVEALVAAVYLDRGLDAARALVDRLLEPRFEHVLRDAVALNVKGALQESVQAKQGMTPTYRVVDRNGPVHAERFTVEVVVGDDVLGRGEGIGKRQAEQRAAEEALTRLRAGPDVPGVPGTSEDQS